VSSSTLAEEEQAAHSSLLPSLPEEQVLSTVQPLEEQLVRRMVIESSELPATFIARSFFYGDLFGGNLVKKSILASHANIVCLYYYS
jgi:ABC-type uncharacterized transport system permease subunit